MKPQYLRYTPEMLQSLGYSVDRCHDFPYDENSKASKQFFDQMCKGKFKNIIDILFNSSDGSLDNDFKKYVTSNAPVEVREFVQNVLMIPTTSILSAPDAETAFDMIVPRSVQCRSQLKPYIDELRTQLVDKFNSIQSPKDS